MTLARERDQWFWVAYGMRAVAMAHDCAARARKEGRPDIAANWDRWAKKCAADPTKAMKIKLPPAYVARFIERPRYF
jgi:hypothetical protein